MTARMVMSRRPLTRCCWTGLAATVMLLSAVQAAPAQDTVERVTTVGPLTATVRLQPAKPLIGDTVTFTLEVRAEADVELLMPDFGEALDRFLIIDFAPLPQRIDDDGRVVAVQRYTLQPRLSGRRSIPPILVEFIDHRPGKPPAPEGEDAYELLTERLDFEVESVIPEDAAAELKPILGELAALQQPSATQWSIGIGTIVFLIVALPFAIKAWLHWRRLARRRSAYDIALQRLERLLAPGLPDGEAIDAFFVELSTLTRQYIENRFELRAPEYTTEEFLEAVSDSPDFSLEHQQLLREFLRQADLVKFAHLLPSETEIHKSVALARRFLDDTRQHAPLIDEDPDAGTAAHMNDPSQGVSARV